MAEKKIVKKSGILQERKAIIKNADMTEDMQQDAVECATVVCVLVWSHLSFVETCANEFCLQ
jgi:hypothetical protein